MRQVFAKTAMSNIILGKFFHDLPMWTRRKVWHGNAFVQIIFVMKQRYAKFEKIGNLETYWHAVFIFEY